MYVHFRWIQYSKATSINANAVSGCKPSPSGVHVHGHPVDVNSHPVDVNGHPVDVNGHPVDVNGHQPHILEKDDLSPQYIIVNRFFELHHYIWCPLQIAKYHVGVPSKGDIWFSPLQIEIFRKD